VDYFNFRLGVRYTVNDARARIIERHYNNKVPLADIKTAIDNFSNDDWDGRNKYCDIVYAIGVRNNIDNFEKWLNIAPKRKHINNTRLLD
jgi:hypothetical protein